MKGLKNLENFSTNQTFTITLIQVSKLSNLVSRAKTKKTKSELVREAIDDLYEKYQKIEDQQLHLVTVKDTTTTAVAQ